MGDNSYSATKLTCLHIVMVRLLQNFDTFELRQEKDAPPGSCPLPHWKEGKGRKRTEKIWPREGVTLYSKACMSLW